jgi:hypothetical protein
VPTAASGGPVTTPAAEDEPTLVDPLQQASEAMDVSPGSRARRRAERAEAHARRRAEKAERKGSAPTEALSLRLPSIPPVVAAIISGLVAGLATVLLAFGAARGCEAVRGTDSCGGGLGLLAVVAILAIAILIGAGLLKAWRIADPFSTSFLGVGVVATIAMLAFLDRINSSSMLVVIPLMTAAAFALSWWITVRVIDEHPMSSELDSERGEPDFREEPQDEDSRA